VTWPETESHLSICRATAHAGAGCLARRQNRTSGRTDVLLPLARARIARSAESCESDKPSTRLAPGTVLTTIIGRPRNRAARPISRPDLAAMKQRFKVGERVIWNSEAGRVRGMIIRVHTKNLDYKGYTHHASEDDAQYEIKSDKTDHVALHRGEALRRARRQA
jgi:Hypervirulence associated proteins TUDOR domain